MRTTQQDSQRAIMDYDRIRAEIHRQMAMTMDLAEETMRLRATPEMSWWHMLAITLVAIGVGLMSGCRL